MRAPGSTGSFSDDEIEAARQRGWYDRLGDEAGTEEDPNERWRDKMESFGCWPEGYERDP